MTEFDYYLAQFVDIHGRPKAKLVPGRHREMIFGAGAGFAGFAIAGMGLGPHGPEFMAVGDRDAIRPVAWMASTASVTCDGHVGGKPHALDPRVIAKKALADFRAATGLEFFSGLEPEFFLLKPGAAAGNWVVATESEALDKPCYDFRHLSSVSGFLMELQAALDGAGIDVYQIDHEDANGQFEMNFTYADGLRTADNLTYFKMAAQALARKHGMLCSFMPKPFAERSGSGLHMHMSAGRKIGDNAFADAQDPRGLELSPMAYHFLGGLVAHAQGLTAIAAPCVNSYKRLVKRGSRSGATWAPVSVAYGDNNRTAFVRIPAGRLELRVPDASSNPYLLTAAVIHAGLDGIARGLSPGEPCNENLYQLSATELGQKGIERLPSSLPEALDALDASEVLRRGLGAAFVDEFLNLKRAECDELLMHIPPAEFNRYVDFY
ncbi:type III glutamate--ammonia ligase [Verminephrobacter aporrectodeae subsp. tuberculatae]|uniref:Type III glutamate--ammonia ligase n=1 Tax=Verminephrobacter aporrectodeae subsp. tuberculatae TaxID=1110392 RepID=A0ABT3KNX4_9BURK|nr:type III glutamate--ammonia ligase [Verminephrobacter aporrectodeae]MCW5257735.1 type III glutamate--ammonia ligase [Verminephrobacter aporrectodeae subsp. tuberculatae]MCW5320021.1 type III glutamate--ammonia ligase [Verminephrobacter aporrectodeae subsp. tuberculatae]MCW8164691.1 type III glutamate--ammonia ligase [Verminephrobacter aporrectodeae subsp. tuberculatae]MCW8169359.1 type III glutamate--ammonia ligase [Verminephrobacter aporrectodeae subsp. tuberculatae]MCW8198506.1 type III g